MRKVLIAVATASLSLVLVTTQASAHMTHISPSPVFDLDAAPPIDDIPKASVAYQFDATHSGFVAANLKLPLRQKWAVNLGAGVGYPVVAGGTIVVAAGGALVGVDAASGATVWSHAPPSGSGWVGPAYDAGNVFSNVQFTSGSSGVGMYAFNAATGAQVWSAVLPGQYVFSSPPTARNGTVYTGGAGSGGTVYAFTESNGHLNWRASVENGDDSSPVVTKTGVFVSYACPQTYEFNPNSGAQVWHYSGPCEGGGGSTAVLHGNLLFVEDSDVTGGYDGIALTSSAGQAAANFNSQFPPAFNRRLGFFVTNSTTLTAAHVPRLTQAWSASIPASDSFATPPLVVGKTVYIETHAGNLLGYAAESGKLAVQMALGFSDGTPGFAPGLGYGGGELIVPAGSELIALTGS